MAQMNPEINHHNGQPNNLKKRLLFVVTQSEYGGAQRFLYSLISRLDRSKYEIVLAAGSNQNGDFLLNQLTKLGIPTKPLKNLKRDITPVSDLKTVFELKRIIQDFKPDTIFLNSSKAGFVGSLAARLVRKQIPAKVIYRIGGWTFNDPWPKWKKLFFIALEKISAGWKDIIIVNNQNDLDQARKLNIKPRIGTILIPNGIDVYKTDFLTKDEARLKFFEKISRYSDKIFQAQTIIGTIANHYPAKGLGFLIEAAEHFKNQDSVVFIIIGDGPLRQDLEAIIRKLELEKKVFLVGQIPEAHRYLPAFDIFVLPSLKEGFPWTVLEAMAAKAPVIATTVGALPEIIEDGKNGVLVEPGNAAQIVKRLKELLADELYCQELALRGHQTVLLKYNLEKMVGQIEAVLQI
ncbi:MAG: glycosyltransferase family 4 protein [Patescibacteria group bacterium]